MSQARIDGGWTTYRRLVVPANASAIQVAETKQAFFAGASFLFYFLLKAMEPDVEPTEADFALMDELQKEIDAFGAQLDARVFERVFGRGGES